MNFLKDVKLVTRLLTGFGFCALITLGVGMIGQNGIGILNENLNTIRSNNLLSIAQTSSARSNVIAHYQNLHRVLLLKLGKGPSGEYEIAIQALKDTETKVNTRFSMYRQTPLAEEEKQVINQFDKDWSTYLTLSNQVVAEANSGNLDLALATFHNQIAATYKKLNDELKFIVDFNDRQSTETGVSADAASQRASWTIGIGVLVAFIAAVGMGLLITRSITRPLAAAVRSAENVAQGDLTHVIEHDAKDEIGLLLIALARMQSNLKSTIQEIANAAMKLPSIEHIEACEILTTRKFLFFCRNFLHCIATTSLQNLASANGMQPCAPPPEPFDFLKNFPTRDQDFSSFKI
ncbi:MCP four helix bundle domain-containing protein [Pseudomonas protegens]|uniref:MCP four helix bundle domain-containing protein n=1 Tax=Pseudomonas protegens TaxID=380021 RepID=UPI003EBF5939